MASVEHTCRNCVWSNELEDFAGVCSDKPWRQNLDQLRNAFIADLDDPVHCARFIPTAEAQSWME